jgi:hypothetical protein
MTMLLTSIVFAILAPAIIAGSAIVHHHWRRSRAATGLGRPLGNAL